MTPVKIRREIKTTCKKEGHLYGASYDAIPSVVATFKHALRLIKAFRRMGDLSGELRIVKDINKMLDYNWNDHVRGSNYEYNCMFWHGETLVSKRISKGHNHNLQTSAGLELDMMTKAGIGGRLLNWVGIGTGSTEPTRGTPSLDEEVVRIPVNPDGWLTPSSDLLFTGVIAGTNTQGGVYKSAAGFTGNTAEDVLGWICVLPEADWINHTQGSTMMIWSHVEEVISLS